MKLLSLLVVILVISTGCATKYVAQPLPMPTTPPVRPSEQSLECVDTETYQMIVNAYKRNQTLRAIIKTTHMD